MQGSTVNSVAKTAVFQTQSKKEEKEPENVTKFRCKQLFKKKVIWVICSHLITYVIKQRLCCVQFFKMCFILSRSAVYQLCSYCSSTSNRARCRKHEEKLVDTGFCIKKIFFYVVNVGFPPLIHTVERWLYVFSPSPSVGICSLFFFYYLPAFFLPLVALFCLLSQRSPLIHPPLSTP